AAASRSSCAPPAIPKPCGSALTSSAPAGTDSPTCKTARSSGGYKAPAGHPPAADQARKDCHEPGLGNRRAYRRNHPHPESRESRKKSNRKYRSSLYRRTETAFAQLLLAQGYACGMCREPFEDRQLIHVDHDHSCCSEKNRSCGKCVRGRATH